MHGRGEKEINLFHSVVTCDQQAVFPVMLIVMPSTVIWGAKVHEELVTESQS